MDRKNELYNKSLAQFISILMNIKLQLRLNPEKAEENITEVIALLRKQIVIPEVKASPVKKPIIIKAEKVPAVPVVPPFVVKTVVDAPVVTEELFVSADKIKEAEEA